MKKLLIALALFISPVPAFAGVSCTLPFNLQNGTTADATQVMANYNALVTCLTNAAAAGINTDITALLGLTTPITPASGGTAVFLGGTSTGSANAYTVSSTTPNSFSLTVGYTVIFIANFTNTGATTLTVNGLTANVYNQSTSGPVAMVGGEIVANQLYAATYDGSQFEVISVGTRASLTQPDQLLSGGANVSAYNGGSQSGGVTFTVDCGKSPLQIITNAGNFTFAAPVSNSASCIVLVVNSGTAGTITFSGFNVGSNTGDALDTTPNHRFMISVVQISTLSTYFIKATQ